MTRKNFLAGAFDDTNTSSIELDFIGFGKDFFESESLTNDIYSRFIELMSEGFTSHHCGQNDSHISEYGRLYKNDLYFPCSERVAFSDTYFKIPTSIYTTNLYLAGINKIMHLSAIQKPVKGIGFIGKGQKVKITEIAHNKEINEFVAHKHYATINNGRILAAQPLHLCVSPQNNAISVVSISLLIGAIEDSDTLWSARITEDLGKQEASVRLGLTSEQIKSLLYARDLPITETGRKRPILHLVRAHNRRLKAGIDIDIKRHIRGVDKIRLAEMDFYIRPPAINPELQKRWE